MATNTNQATSSAETKQRFQEAKQRYNEMNTRNTASVSDDNNTPDPGNILDFISKRADRMAVPRTSMLQPMKTTKADLPIPLPVKSITDDVVSLQQVRTNKLLQNLDHSVQNSVPQPLKIDATEIAHESTLMGISNTLEKISAEIIQFPKVFEGKFDTVGDKFVKGFADFGAKTKDERGWMTKTLDKTLGFIKGSSPKIESMSETMSKLFTPVTGYSKKTVDYLREIYQIQREQANATTTADLAKESLGSDKPKGAMSGMFDVLFPKETMMRSVFETIGKMGAFFKSVGDSADKGLKSSGISSAIFSAVGAKPLVAGALKLIGALGGMGTFIGGIVGAVAFAPFYAMFRNPDQLMGMLGAFSNLFTKAILPTFIWINKELVPPLSIAFAGLMVVADYLLNTLGTAMNKVIIPVLGTAIPEILGTMGRMFDSVWQGLKGVVMRIAGIFGVGEHGGKGFFANIFGAFVSFSAGLHNLVDEALTSLLRLFGIADFFGITKEEGLYGRIGRFFMEDIPSFVNGAFQSIIDYMMEFDIVRTVAAKLGEFIQGIVNLIPTWKDMKQWMADSIPSWVGDGTREWLLGKLGDDPEPEPTTMDRIVNTSTETGARVVDAARSGVGVASQYARDRIEDIKANETIQNLAKEIKAAKIPAQQMYDQAVGATQGAIKRAQVMVNSPTVNNVSSNVFGGGNSRWGPPATTVAPTPIDGLLYGNTR